LQVGPVGGKILGIWYVAFDNRRKKMPGNHNEIEKRLWEAADQLRANSSLTAQEYSRLAFFLANPLPAPNHPQPMNNEQ
jgi:hypothetical protein